MTDVSESTYWTVTVSRGGETIVTIEPNLLTGREIGREDEDAIRTAAHHLLSFLGDGATEMDAEIARFNELLEPQCLEALVPVIRAALRAALRSTTEPGDLPSVNWKRGEPYSYCPECGRREPLRSATETLSTAQEGEPVEAISRESSKGEPT